MLATTINRLLGGLAFCAAINAQAIDLSYDYAELRYVDLEVSNIDGDGFLLGGSFRLTKEWLVVGSYTDVDFDNDADGSALSIGAGYVYPYSDTMDIVGYGSVVRAETDTRFGNEDDTGISLSGGVRGLLTPQVEGRASFNYVNIDDSDTFVELGGDYHFNPQLSAGATIELGGDADQFSLGVRWYFSN